MLKLKKEEGLPLNCKYKKLENILEKNKLFPTPNF